MRFEKPCREMERALEGVEQSLADPAVLADQPRYRDLARTHSELSRVVAKWREFQKVRTACEEARSLLKDPDAEMAEMARVELEEAEPRLAELEQEIGVLLLPADPDHDRNTIIEIRAGTGGDEAALFAGDLLRMYAHYAEARGWKAEVLSGNPTELGGFKEVIFGISGDGAYNRMRFESGIHRVQRVPATEASGRIHTSAVTVAVMPEADEVDLVIAAEDLRVDVFRSSGPGGQSVNTTDSAVRLTHVPTGLVVSCQDEKSQIKNRAQAMKVMRSRLYDLEVQRRHAEESEKRRQQVGSGDRSGRIRTYNFPQNRLTDHRIGLTLYKLDAVVEGELDELFDALIEHEQTQQLEGLGDM